MRKYEQMSGTFFALIALAQLTRSILGLPVQVGSMSIPIWWSIVACLLTGGMSVWAFRSARSAP